MSEEIKVKNEEIEVSRKEHKALLQPLKRVDIIMKKIKELSTKLWQVIHYPVKINWLSLLAILAVIVSILVVVFVLKGKNNDTVSQKTSVGAFAISKKMDKLYQSYTYYTRVATKEEMMYTWIELFSNAKYKRDGDPKKENFDCVSSVYTFLRSFNSNVRLVDVKSLVYICENLSQRGELEIRQSINRVKPGDIIVIQLTKGDPSHLGVVMDVKNNYVIYAHVNGKVMGSSFSEYKWGDYHIYAIYEVSYSLWVGSLLKEFNERKR